MINLRLLSLGAVGLSSLTLIGCSGEGVYPTYPDPYKTQQANLVVDRPGENITYHREYLGSPEWVEMNRNAEITIADRDKKESCYRTCLEENAARYAGYQHLKEIRETVRSVCSSVGDTFAHTSEDSPTAHNRIVENEGTGELEYRERTIHVVRISAPWKCPESASDEVKDIAAHWMHDSPPGLEQKFCGRIKTTAFTGIPIEVCERWVHDIGR